MITLSAVLGSIVIVAVVELIREILKRFRSKGERENENFINMRAVVAEYMGLVEIHKKTATDANDAYERLKVNLDEASTKVVELEHKVHSLEMALGDAQILIDRLFEMKKVP